MKRVWLLFVMICLLPLTMPTVAWAGQVVKVGVYQNHPQLFINAQGRGEGFYMDLLGFVSAQEGWSLKMVPGSWTEGLERLNSGEVDLLLAVPFADQLFGRLDFNNETFLANWGQLYVADARLQSIPDLDDKTIIGLKNHTLTTQFEQLLKQFGIKAHFLLVDDYAQALEWLVSGKGDAAIVAKTFGLVNDRNYQVLRSAIVCCPLEMRLAAKKGLHADLLEVIDRHLHTLKADNGSYYFHAMNRWFGTGEVERLPVWVFWMIVLGGLFLLVVVMLFVRLKQQMRMQTAALRYEIAAREVIDGQLKRTNQELEANARKLEANARELRASKEVAEAASRAKSQFLTNMGHETRTPMNAIQGMTEMALQIEVSPKTRELLGHVLTASRSLMRIINSILAFSKLDRGQEILVAEPFDLLDDVFAHVMDFAASSAAAKSIDLSFELEPGTPRKLIGDREKLENILIALVDNALKFTNQNKGRVILRALLRQRYGEKVQLEFLVQDTGVGVEPEQQLRIFDPFVQGDATLTRRYGGVGMGLAVCKRLVELMRGRIWVESGVGQGSRFYFTILFKTSELLQDAPTNGAVVLTASVDQRGGWMEGVQREAASVMAADGSAVVGSSVRQDGLGVDLQQRALLQRLAIYLDYGDLLGAEQTLSVVKEALEGVVDFDELHKMSSLLDEFEFQAARHLLGGIAESLNISLQQEQE